MISPHLPAGTKVQFIPLPDGNPACIPGLDVWHVYTVRDFMTYPNGNIGVRLFEFRNVIRGGVEYGLSRARFRVVQLPPLPASITDCLNVHPKVDA